MTKKFEENTVRQIENINGIEVQDDTMRSIFRTIFAGEDYLTELYPVSVSVSPKDIDELNTKINEKLKHYKLYGLTFKADVTYVNNRSEEYGSWDRFINERWSSPHVLESISIWWKFLTRFPDTPKPSLHSINVRIASPLPPQHLIQAMFSKDPETLDKLDLSMSPILCRIDFVDQMLSQELLDIVSKWVRGLNAPEYVFPFMKKLKKYSLKISKLAKYSIPLITAIAFSSYFVNFSNNYAPNSTITIEYIQKTIYWFLAFCFGLVLSYMVGSKVGLYIERSLHRFGFFNVLMFTRGDNKKRTELMAKSNNSVWKFIISSGFAIVWNVISGFIIHHFLTN